MTTPSDEPTEDREYRARLRDFGVETLKRASILGHSSWPLVRGWCTALDRAGRPAERLPPTTRAWVQEMLPKLASDPASDNLRSLAAEVEAALRLSWLGEVERVPEQKGTPTVDFKVAGLHVEVFCPQEHTEERRVVEADLAQQREHSTDLIKVAVAISHPTTGSGRKVDENGVIRREPDNKALTYPANKVIDRLLHKKRDGKQFSDGEPNVLWLDLKHGLGLTSRDCVPFRSYSVGDVRCIGTHGPWHAFYGETGSPHFADRTTIEWPICQPAYEQQKQGWFRELPKVAGAVLSVTDGVILLENPWASVRLNETQRRQLFSLADLQPDVSWSDCAGTLEHDIDSILRRIAWLADLAGSREEDDDPAAPETA